MGIIQGWVFGISSFLWLIHDNLIRFWQNKRRPATFRSKRWVEGNDILTINILTRAVDFLVWRFCGVDDQAAWEIFTPLLHRIDDGELNPLPYKPGSRGPEAADELLAKAGYVQTHGYIWIPPTL